MRGGAGQARAKRLDAIAAAGRRIDPDRETPVPRGPFLKHYFDPAHDEDLLDDATYLAAAALSHLAWAATRKPRTAKVRVFNPTVERDGWTSKHTIVQTVNDDMPFLVDSLTMGLNARGHGIQRTLHPVLYVGRGRNGRLTAVANERTDEATKPESLIQFEITRETRRDELEEIQRSLAETLASVRVAVDDYPAMVEHLRDASEQVRQSPGSSSAMKEESAKFLEWLADDNFTLLGYREFDLEAGDDADRLVPRSGTGLGILRDSGTSATTLSGKARQVARSKVPLVITKSAARSKIHRPAQLDYIAVKTFDGDGKPNGERRFLGLFTSIAYNERASDIPLLRQKTAEVMEQSGVNPYSHRGKALQHILDTFPRDDLIQGSIADLQRISLGILQLQERHTVRLFMRSDPFDRFYSCLVFVPRDRYSADVRRRVERILLEGLDGRTSESRVSISDSVLARIEVIVRTPDGRTRRPDLAALQDRVTEAARSWADRVRAALLEQFDEETALDLFNRYAERFPLGYQAAADAARACRDILKLAAMDADSSNLGMTLGAAPTGQPNELRFTTFQRSEPIKLYLANPILENMGVRVVGEDNYEVAFDDGAVWIQDFDLETDQPVDLGDGADERFQQTFARTLSGDAENDSFNAFVLEAGLDWRNAALLRAYCKYILQTYSRFSQAYMRDVLSRYPRFCGGLVDHFHGAFDPSLSRKERQRKRADGKASIDSELERTTSLDEDRILRSFSSAVRATVRTNFFQLQDGAPKRYLSIKLESAKIPELPRPKPMFEIFVYSDRFEGVHLRCGRIARGGIRWSDRREDFRTEILGLMKAQQVKNTVIVPAGAKGGFVCKRLPAGDRAAIQQEAVACYTRFIRGLLDITDNLVDGETVTPQDVIARDDPDPYLVVAADKGTATFSDIANGVAAEYGFWLGDAFASGGSAGYDHKKMAITARGGWEAVRRHFRELNVDVQTQEFTVVGIGDMAGDVFGNGMLLSEKIRLVAAFNHLHIFIDPDPDPAASFAERKRLFELPRSSWDDYDRGVLSEGGGIYSRQSKRIELHPAAMRLLGLDAASVTPLELIRAVLTARADLLWNGGIGTYVKASDESHLDAADPANDGVRVNGDELRVRVVGEGGNLGMTQRGRIEYALAGGRLNTDFIDNSGGVDSSDREVNIKILLNDAIRQGVLARNRRNALLARMTEDVAERVLETNYAQTQALSMMASRSTERIGEHARVIRVLESRGLLDRGLEFLPSDEQIDERRQRGIGLTRPELAVILSYAKIELASSLAETDVADDPHCARELERYFPKRLVERFGAQIESHTLRKEIVAMLISSSMINRMGPYFALRARDETGAGTAQVARAYAIVREIFDTRTLWAEIEGLDLAVQAEVQYDCIFEISRMVRRAVYWFLQRHPGELPVGPLAERFKPGIVRLTGSLHAVLAGRSRKRFDSDVQEFESLGVPRPVGRRIAGLRLMTQLLDVVEIAREQNIEIDEAGKLYFELGKGLKLDWLREQIDDLRVQGHWSAIARATLRESLAKEQHALMRHVLAKANGGPPMAAMAHWLTDEKAQVARAHQTLNDIRSTGQMDFATLSVALKEINRLVGEA